MAEVERREAALAWDAENMASRASGGTVLDQGARVMLLGAMLALVIAMDWLTGPWISFSIFYLAPVLAAALWYGRVAAIGVGVFSALSWLTIDRMSMPLDFHVGVHLWNSLVRLAFFTIFAELTIRLARRGDRAAARADTDPLTELPNLRQLTLLGDHEVARAQRYGGTFSLLFIDLDSFKALNDTRGHGEGDRCLRAVAEVLRHSTRSVDLAARVGGDEFAVLLPATDTESASTVVEAIRGGIAEVAKLHRWPIGASVGAATFERPPATFAAAMELADRAMYAEKGVHWSVRMQAPLARATPRHRPPIVSNGSLRDRAPDRVAL